MTPSREFTIQVHEGVGDVIRRAEEMMQEAARWIASGDWMPLYGLSFKDSDYDAIDKQASQLGSQLDVMRLSFYRNLTQLFGFGLSGGGLHLWWDFDGEGLAWRQEHGINGGLVFHADRKNGQRLPIGEWSLHS